MKHLSIFFIMVLAGAISFYLYLNQTPEKIKLPSFVPADDWFERQRAYPFDEIPNEERLNAIEYVKMNMHNTSAVKFGQTLVWESAGPTNIEGRITTVAIHPTNPQIVYVGTANGGVWKSENFCQSYTPVFDNTNTTSIGDIAIDPVDPNIIYCGTGEANSLRSYYPGTGIYKSTDAGVTWNYTGLGETNSIGRIAINPLNTNEIYVAALGALRKKNDQRGLFKSTNGGITWDNVIYLGDSVGVVDVVIDPNNPSKVFAASWERMRREDFIKYGGPKTALYASTNSGVSWSVVNGGFPSNSSDLGRISMDISKSNPNIIYALTAYANGNSRGLYKSTDGGVSWTLKNSSVAYSSNYAWFNRICRVHPTNQEIVYCGGLDMMQSTNGGTNFNFVNDSYVDHHALAFSLSNPNYVVIGNDGGIDHSTNGGAVWIPSATLPISQFYAGEINPGNPEDILGGTQDNSTIRTVNGSLNNWQVIYGGDGFYCLVDYQNPNKIYASSQYGGLGRSTDGGNSFLSATSGLDLSYTNWMTPFVMDKNIPSTLYCGTYRIHRSTNSMQSWTPISPDLANGHIVNLGTITTVDVSKSNPNVIYCGTDDANVWVTTNGGTDWTKIINGLPDRWVTRVTIHPDSANVCYVTLSGYKIDSTGAHIFRTSNFGNTWIPINGNLPDAPINDVIIDPLDYNSLYIATDDGVFFTTNLGVSWGILADGIPATVPCHDLTLDNATRKLVVWTHGRSAYKLILPDPPVPVELSSFTAELINSDVNLNWTTSSEINNNGFIVERRLFGAEFIEIGFVKGSGTSTEIIKYSFADKNILPGKYSYRLRQVDYNGSFEYSKIIDVELKDEIEFTLSQNYPNPFNPTTKIHYSIPSVTRSLSKGDAYVKLKVYDNLGNEIATLVNEEKPAGTYEVEFNASQLSSGIYFYKIQAGNFTQTKKMLLLK